MLKKRDLSIFGYANGFSLWHYPTEDSDVFNKGYFDEVHEMFRAGDLIHITVKASDSAFTTILNVSRITDGTVILNTMMTPDLEAA